MILINCNIKRIEISNRYGNDFPRLKKREKISNKLCEYKVGRDWDYAIRFGLAFFCCVRWPQVIGQITLEKKGQTRSLWRKIVYTTKDRLCNHVFRSLFNEWWWPFFVIFPFSSHVSSTVVWYMMRRTTYQWQCLTIKLVEKRLKTSRKFTMICSKENSFDNFSCNKARP